LRAARAHAALAGRDHVLPDDVQALVLPVLAHRVILTGETQLAHRSAVDVLRDLVHRVPVPAPTT
jgi:MoxR-like ATPase